MCFEDHNRWKCIFWWGVVAFNAYTQWKTDKSVPGESAIVASGFMPDSREGVSDK